MANRSGISRSNSFRVKDENEFRRWAEVRGVSVGERYNDPTLFWLHTGFEGGTGMWPDYDAEKDAPIDFMAELATHLAKGQIAVLMTTGDEKLRYVTGSAFAVNDAGRVVGFTLDAIYAQAARAFRVPSSEITRAEY